MPDQRPRNHRLGNFKKPAISIAGFYNSTPLHLVAQCGRWVTIFYFRSANRCGPEVEEQEVRQSFHAQIFREERKICPRDQPKKSAPRLIFCQQAGRSAPVRGTFSFLDPTHLAGAKGAMSPAVTGAGHGPLSCDLVRVNFFFSAFLRM
jgi:hypothetical protein